MIQSIRLQHFRSYGDGSFEFRPGVNIIVGPNASGKTNLLEALLVVSRGGSFRARDAELVGIGESWARLDASVEGASRSVKLTVDPTPDKTYELDGRVFKKLSLERSLPVVLFEPNHLLLLNGSPERRRDYLDDLLSQTTVGYGSVVRAYRRTLAQRNRLLKSGRAAASHLFPWDVRLSELGGRMARARSELVGLLNGQIGTLYRDLARSPTSVELFYKAGGHIFDYESIMLRELERRRTDDLTRGFTGFGPHREDIEVRYDGSAAQDVASRGETRTLVLGLKILELHLLEAARDQTPLLLLDDVFSELDGTRRQALTEHLRPYQTFITTTDADVVQHHFVGGSNILMTTKG